MGDMRRTRSEQGPSWARTLVVVGAATACAALGLLVWTLVSGAGAQLADPDAMRMPAELAVSAGMLLVGTVMVGIATALRS